MFDIGVTKLAIVGGIALIVIGPERLPRVARMLGTLLGRAQRYVADVKAEVNRSIELEELQKMRSQFETAARDVHDTVNKEFNETRAVIAGGMSSLGDASDPPVMTSRDPSDPTSHYAGARPAYKPPKKNWRVKRAAVPAWYKQRNGVRTYAQSGAARVARFRPRGSNGSAI